VLFSVALIVGTGWYLYAQIRPTPDANMLAESALLGNVDGVRRALNAGVDPDGDSDGSIPLLLAASGGDVQSVALLLEHGANPSRVSPVGYTPLLMAATHGNLKAMILLLDAGADPNQSTHAVMTPLAAAAAFGQEQAVLLLLARGADASARVPEPQVYHEPPLLCALQCSGASEAIILPLIKGGADVNAVDDEGLTPLQVAESMGRGDLVKLLLRHGARRYVARVAQAAAVDQAS